MKKDKLLQSMGDIDEKYILEYERARKARKQSVLLRAVALAASVCLVIGVAAAIPLLTLKDEGDEGTPPVVIEGTEGLTDTGSNPTEPTASPIEPDLPKGPMRVLNVTAEKQSGDFISADTDFIVEAENATADLVREHIYISGGPEYTVTDEGDGKYRVSLAGSLSAGNVISLSYASEGVTEYSWAFETERKLEIVTHTPAKDRYEVLSDSVIELTLSMVGDESFPDYVTISPEISGKWECLGKVMRFVPESYLPDDTDFTVSVAPGYTANGYTLDEYSFSFSTKSHPRIGQGRSPAYGGMLYFAPGETVRFSVSPDYTVSEVRLYTFFGAEDMVAYLSGDEAFLLGEYTAPDFEVREVSNQAADISVGGLSEGYYLAELRGGDDDYVYRSPICVHPTATYAAVTERDIVIWADDEGIPVRYGDITAKTNENGIAILKGATDGSGEPGFVLIGEGEKPLIFTAPNFTFENYPTSYLYTDKPLYKSTDTVHFFGAVPKELFYDGTDGEFTLTFSSGGYDLRTLMVAPDENGVFSGSFDFTSLAEDYGYITLYYNGSRLASRHFEVEDYYLQNYFYEIDCPREYVTVGSTLDFTVTVTHISGMEVSGKRVCAKKDGVYYYATTDESGIAHFSIPGPTAELDSYGSTGSAQIRIQWINLYNGDPEEGSAAYDSIGGLYYHEIYEDADLIYNANYMDTDLPYRVFTFKGVHLRPEKTHGLNNVSTQDFYEEGATINGSLTLILRKTTRERNGSKVDPYTGKHSPTYIVNDPTEEVLCEVEVSDVSEYVFTNELFALPKADELTSYEMYLRYSFELGEGNTDSGSLHVDSNYFLSVDSPSASGSNDNVGVEVYTSGLNSFSSSAYHFYRYVMNGDLYGIRAGERVELTLYDTVAKKEVSEGALLRIIYRNGVMETDLVTPAEASFTFKEEYGPFVSVTYAYHLNGRFYRLPAYVVTQAAEERTVTITQETDKEYYAPGEEVTLTVKTTDHKGEPISCAVNVSVVNEAVFLDRGDYIDIFNDLIYRNDSNYPMYSFSTFFDRELYYFTGGMGDGGADEVRINFSDTACFETVLTDEEGVAVVTFTLPDSVTEYRITTHAARKDMYYGSTKSNFKVQMDFFLQSSAPRGQKHTDDFVAYATTVSNAAGEVDLTFTLKETGQVITAKAYTGSAASANFGKLPVGSYTLRIDAAMGEYTDAMEIQIEVAAGSMFGSYTLPLAEGTPVTVNPSSYPVKISVYTETAQRYLGYFSFLKGLPRTRMDTALTSVRADKLYNLILKKNENEAHIRINDDFLDGALLSMYTEGEGDVVLTALSNYYTPELHTYGLPLNIDSPEKHLRSLLYEASLGRGSISELKAAEQYIADEEHTAIIGLGYAFLGDYDSALRMYSALPERSEVRGADALRAILATFVAKEDATAILDTLINEEKDEFYLGFALLSYLERRIAAIDEDHTATLTVNGVSAEYTVNGLQIKELYLEDDGSGAVTLSYSSDGKVRVDLTYSDYEHVEKAGAFYAYLEGDIHKYGTAYLAINLEGYSGQRQLSISLPPSLRVSGGAAGNGVYCSAKHEQVSVYVSKDFSGTVYLPLLVTQTGNYKIEPIRLTTESGNRYYSNELTLDIE